MPVTAKQMLDDIKEATGWNANQIALRVGISASTIYRIDDGTSTPHDLTTAAIERLWRKHRPKRFASAAE